MYISINYFVLNQLSNITVTFTCQRFDNTADLKLSEQESDESKKAVDCVLSKINMIYDYNRT